MLGGDRHDPVPQKRHVPRGEHAEREHRGRQVGRDQRIVVQFLAARRLDREQICTGRCARREALDHPLPFFA